MSCLSVPFERSFLPPITISLASMNTPQFLMISLHRKKWFPTVPLSVFDYKGCSHESRCEAQIGIQMQNLLCSGAVWRGAKMDCKLRPLAFWISHKWSSERRVYCWKVLLKNLNGGLYLNTSHGIKRTRQSMKNVKLKVHIVPISTSDRKKEHLPALLLPLFS